MLSSVRSNRSFDTVPSAAVRFRTRASRAPVNSDVNPTGLRTALWRCDLGAELPLLADTCLMPLQANDDPKQKYTASFTLI